MKKNLLIYILMLLALPVWAQQQPKAKVVLDKTAAAFRKAGGVQVGFTVKMYDRGVLSGTSDGAIQINGEKFYLQTPETKTWFDGKTQWSYVVANEEVNVTTPTDAELQSLNPYALLTIYQKGFNYKLGTTQSYQGKPVDEVVLTPIAKRQDLSSIVLYVTKNTSQPLLIRVEQPNKSFSEIAVESYKGGQKYADSQFAFDKKKYPRAEVIDLR